MSELGQDLPSSDVERTSDEPPIAAVLVQSRERGMWAIKRPEQLQQDPFPECLKVHSITLIGAGERKRGVPLTSRTGAPGTLAQLAMPAVLTPLTSNAPRTLPWIQRAVRLEATLLDSVSDHSALESRMSGYWLPFGSCLIGIIGALIALKYGRITTETQRNYLLVAFMAVLVALAVSYDWPSSQARTFADIRDKYDSIGLRYTDLQKRVNANNAATQAEEQALQESWRRLRSGELDATTVDRQRDRIGANAKEFAVLKEERQALEKEIAAVGAEFEEAKRSKAATEFWRALALTALMPALLVLALRSRN